MKRTIGKAALYSFSVAAMAFAASETAPPANAQSSCCTSRMDCNASHGADWYCAGYNTACIPEVGQPSYCIHESECWNPSICH